MEVLFPFGEVAKFAARSLAAGACTFASVAKHLQLEAREAVLYSTSIAYKSG